LQFVTIKNSSQNAHCAINGEKIQQKFQSKKSAKYVLGKKSAKLQVLSRAAGRVADVADMSSYQSGLRFPPLQVIESR
jgi:hypothetical protein